MFGCIRISSSCCVIFQCRGLQYWIYIIYVTFSIELEKKR